MTTRRSRYSEMEYAHLRVTLWRLVFELLRATHAQRFPGRRFGPDIGLLFAYGAAIVLFLENKPVRASTIARVLQMPHETARRYLKELQRLKLLEPEDHTMRPTSHAAKGYNPDRLVAMIKKGAAELM